jgi:hypothetical protein
MIRAAQERAARKRYREMAPVLDEQGRRRFAAMQAKAFSFISINWRGKPLRTFRTIVELIASTTTDAGLKVRAELDQNKYATKVKVSKNELAAINLSRHSFYGDWNYTISPNRKTK